MFDDIKQIWKNRMLIIEGAMNKMFKHEHVELIAEHRLQICEECIYMDKVGTSCMVPGIQPCCSECGCGLNLKTRSLASECPKGKWLSYMSDQDEYKFEKLLGNGNNE